MYVRVCARLEAFLSRVEAHSHIWMAPPGSGRSFVWGGSVWPGGPGRRVWGVVPEIQMQ